MSNPFASLGPADFADALQATLPRGKAWPREPNAEMSALMQALSARIAAVHARATTLSERESDPRSTIELLPDWEAAFGLPDPCTPLNATIQQRQAALVARIAGASGQSRAYFTQLAATLGFSIAITEFHSFVAGRSAAGDLLLGPGADFTWQVNADAAGTFVYFRAGQSVAGEPLYVEQNAVLECVMNREKPAQTQVIFNYGG